MCPHSISTARMTAWWARDERFESEGRKRDVWVCGCCGGPCPSGEERCRFCEGKAA